MLLLRHRFVQYIPETLEPGILYISVEYVTASHLCCCGCGMEIVTPFSPVGWRMTFDGATISLWPSIGNWNLRCRSHYIIDRGRVVVAGSWTDSEVATKQRHDKEAKADYFETTPAALPAPKPPIIQTPNPQPIGWFSRLRRRWFGE